MAGSTWRTFPSEANKKEGPDVIQKISYRFISKIFQPVEHHPQCLTGIPYSRSSSKIAQHLLTIMERKQKRVAGPGLIREMEGKTSAVGQGPGRTSGGEEIETRGREVGGCREERFKTEGAECDCLLEQWFLAPRHSI